ncbi:MAG: LuxR C-terminal-related transcriptional regulator [Rubrivivax sp.]
MRGLTNKEIAKALAISPRTVQHHHPHLRQGRREEPRRRRPVGGAARPLRLTVGAAYARRRTADARRR